MGSLRDPLWARTWYLISVINMINVLLEIKIYQYAEDYVMISASINFNEAIEMMQRD